MRATRQIAAQKLDFEAFEAEGRTLRQLVDQAWTTIPFRTAGWDNLPEEAVFFFGPLEFHFYTSQTIDIWMTDDHILSLDVRLYDADGRLLGKWWRGEVHNEGILHPILGGPRDRPFDEAWRFERLPTCSCFTWPTPPTTDSFEAAAEC